jgi:uncharacterized membrane protein YphA (DoxX/SURF4 family)
VLSAASIALLTTTLVTVLAFHATAGQQRFRQPSGMSNPVIDRDSQVLLVITVVLVVLIGRAGGRRRLAAGPNPWNWRSAVGCGGLQ